MQKRLTDGKTIAYPPEPQKYRVYGEGTSHRPEYAPDTDEEPAPQVINVKATESPEEKLRKAAKRKKHTIILGAFLLTVFWIALIFFIDIPTKGRIFSYDFDRRETGLSSVRVKEEYPDIVLNSEEDECIRKLRDMPAVQKWIEAWKSADDEGRSSYKWLDNEDYPVSQINGHDVRSVYFSGTKDGYRVMLTWTEITDGKEYRMEIGFMDGGSFEKNADLMEGPYSVLRYKNVNGQCTKYISVFHHNGLIDLIRDANREE